MSGPSSVSVDQATKPSRPYLDLGRVSLPTQVRIEDRELDVADLSDQQKLVLMDLARVDKEISDAEFTLRTLGAAKAELSRLFSRLASAPDGSSSNPEP